MYELQPIRVGREWGIYGRMAPRKRNQWQRKNSNPFESVGALLAHFRVVSGQTQAELASRVIISESKLASIEQGRRPLALALAQELDEIEQRVAIRLARQEILQRRVPPAATFILSEAILRDRIGGRAVHTSQLLYLREAADVPGITLQVLPLGRTTHAGLDGPFVLMETPEHDHLAYAETQRGSLLINDPDEVSILARKYAMLRTQALNSEETKGLLDRLLGEQ